jgi:hypothetical protein
MNSLKLKNLLKEKADREEFEYRVIAALNIRYERTEIENTVAKDSATAGHVYSYLSVALKEVNSTKFQARIKEILTEHNIVKPVSSAGIVWFKGLGALKEDLEVGKACLEQHKKDRETYRCKQRAFANRRYQKQLPNEPGSGPDSE